MTSKIKIGVRKAPGSGDINPNYFPTHNGRRITPCSYRKDLALKMAQDAADNAEKMLAETEPERGGKLAGHTPKLKMRLRAGIVTVFDQNKGGGTVCMADAADIVKWHASAPDLLSALVRFVDAATMPWMQKRMIGASAGNDVQVALMSARAAIAKARGN